MSVIFVGAVFIAEGGRGEDWPSATRSTTKTRQWLAMRWKGNILKLFTIQCDTENKSEHWMGSLRHGSTILTSPTKEVPPPPSTPFLRRFHRGLRYAIQRRQVERIRNGNISTKFSTVSPREPALMLRAPRWRFQRAIVIFCVHRKTRSLPTPPRAGW